MFFMAKTLTYPNQGIGVGYSVLGLGGVHSKLTVSIIAPCSTTVGGGVVFGVI